jgi:hypothetical protein
MEAGDETVSVRSASGSERPWIESLSQFYISGAKRTFDISQVREQRLVRLRSPVPE